MGQVVAVGGGPLPVAIPPAITSAGPWPDPGVQVWSELAEMATWLVFECTQGSHTFWAWCRVGGGIPDVEGPLFLDTFYSTADGAGPADIKDAPTQLGRFLFQVQLPVETP